MTFGIKNGSVFFASDVAGPSVEQLRAPAETSGQTLTIQSQRSGTTVAADLNGGDIIVALGDKRNSGYAGAIYFGEYGAVAKAGAGGRMVYDPEWGSFCVGAAVGTEWNRGNLGPGAIAMGYNVTASGQRSMCQGDGCTASGTSSVAMGHDATASGNYSICIGNTSSAIGVGSVAIGPSCVAAIDNTIAFGPKANATRPSQMARGSGYGVVAGDIQRSDASFVETSAEANTVDVLADILQFLVTAGKSYTFDMHLQCNCLSGSNAGQVAIWHFKGAVKNVGGTTSFIGTPLSLVAGGAGGWTNASVACAPTFTDAGLAAVTAQLVADDASDTMKLNGTGIVGAVVANAFRWTTTIYLSEATTS